MVGTQFLHINDTGGEFYIDHKHKTKTIYSIKITNIDKLIKKMDSKIKKHVKENEN